MASTADYEVPRTGKPVPEAGAGEGGRRRTRGRKSTLKAKTLRRMLKKKGMKTTGKKTTLLKRLHLRGGGALSPGVFALGGGNPESRGEPSSAGNYGVVGYDYANKVSAGFQNGGRRRRRSSSSSSGRGY